MPHGGAGRALAITAALVLELYSVWWAGISGFMTVLATGSASLRRGLARAGATLIGVSVGFVDRCAGITAGLAVLMIVSVALWPGVDERHGHAEAAG